MQLSSFTDVALRIVMRLAVLEQVATTRSLADQLHVSYTHATKVVTALVGLGVVDSQRGRAGGLRLAEGAHEVTVGRIARALEGPDEEMVECEGDTPCPLRRACLLRGALRDAREAFFAHLDGLTLADVTHPPTRAVLLELGPSRTD